MSSLRLKSSAWTDGYANKSFQRLNRYSRNRSVARCLNCLPVASQWHTDASSESLSGGEDMERDLFRDTIPYDMPSSLAALRGSATGPIELPLTVYWGPGPVFDLDRVGDRNAAYRAIVREGTAAVQEALLNEELLRRTWKDLILPDRCRAAWEAAFPELGAS